MRWRYNSKLGRWYHPTSAVSGNGPDDPPAEIEGDGKARSTVPHVPRDVTECAGCGQRSGASKPEPSRPVPADYPGAATEDVM